MIKRILKIAAWVVVIILTLIICYIWFYDGSKPFLIKPVINEVHLTEQLQRLEQVEAERHESIYENGKNKAILVFNSGKNDEDPITLKEQFKYDLENEHFPYYELDTTPPMAVVFYDWQYQSLKNKYFEYDDYNTYKQLYGKEAAKGKPAYRYYLKFLIERGEIRYVVRAFCNNSDFLDEIITEFVNQVNSLE